MDATRGAPRSRFPHAIALLAGFVISAFGLWALIAPRSFFDAVATFEPYNTHFLHDIGSFQLGIGATLFLAAFARDALLVALAGASIGALAHLVSHLVDRDLGGTPETDIPFLGVVALLLVAGAIARARA